MTTNRTIHRIVVMSTVSAIALYAGVGARLANAAPGDIYNLGTLGESESFGYAINASGQVAGFTNTPGSGSHAFRYTGTPDSGGAMADLGGTYSYGTGINATGQVTGSSSSPGSGSHAFRYTGTPGSGGAMADLGTLGGSSSNGYGINASGQVAGYSQTTGNSGNHAFRTAPNAAINPATDDLGTLGGSASYGYGINASGQVAGQSDTGSLPGVVQNHAFRYTGTPGSGGAMVDLGTLGTGFNSSIGYAINDAGQVTGSSFKLVSLRPPLGITHAFRTAPNAVINPLTDDLGTLGGKYSFGYAINASGQVAGKSTPTGSSDYHAFLYTGSPGVDGLMIDLDSWLDATNPTEGAKWTLTEARGLNDAGLITGIGAYNDGVDGLGDGNRAFLLDASSLVAAPPGDYNQDGVVDAADYAEWQMNFGSNIPDTDGNGNGLVDAADYVVWRKNLGAALGSSSSAAGIAAAVPEPSSMVLAAIGLAVIRLVNRRRTAGCSRGRARIVL